MNQQDCNSQVSDHLIQQDEWKNLAKKIKRWGINLGFNYTAITDINLSECEPLFIRWLENNYHGEMAYMQKHGLKRTHPDLLVENTIRVITVRMDYLSESQKKSKNILNQQDKAYISRYALGRDYHKVIRKRLQKLANRITDAIGKIDYRAFCDSAPVMEKALAAKSGQGWQGKHTNIINKESGSWFFLGELYTNLPLPIDQPVANHCGSCNACMDICPTQAIIAPYLLDARRCISYLTIELQGSIPEEFRRPMGNRIYGCDDCQLVCPWNKYAKITQLSDFKTRHQLNDRTLIQLFSWNEEKFLSKTEGSAIRRIGHERWLRNIAVALGNAPTSHPVIEALKEKRNHPSTCVREHVGWALAQHHQPRTLQYNDKNRPK